MKKLFVLLTFAALLIGCGSEDTQETEIEITPEIYEFLGGDANKRLVYDADGNRICWVLTEFEYTNHETGKRVSAKIEDDYSFFILTFSDDFRFKHYFVKKNNSVSVESVDVSRDMNYIYSNNVIEYVDIKHIQTSLVNKPWIEDWYHEKYIAYQYIDELPVKIEIAPIAMGWHLTYAFILENIIGYYIDTYIQAPLSDYPYID